MSKTVRAVLASVLICLVLAYGLSSGVANGQLTTAAHADKSGTESLSDNFKFEVVSVRPVSMPRFGPHFNITQNGFNGELPLWSMIRGCYAPEEFLSWARRDSDGAIRVNNLPNWSDNYYEIKAHVADGDVEAWRNQGNRQELLHSALRNVLKERFKLVIRQQPIEVAGLHLVTSKKGAKLKVTPPGFVFPSGRPLRSGGVAAGEGGYRWHYYGASMEDLAQWLSMTTARPVQDSTGLTGRYEFVIEGTGRRSDDPADRTDDWPIDQLGLALTPGKVPGRMLLIDHVEKPSEN
jgi:uncharacterized protein (TIGR03435 family)